MSEMDLEPDQSPDPQPEPSAEERSLDDRLREAIRTCGRTVAWTERRTPAQELAEVAAACEELGVEWDSYGDGGAVEVLEARLAELLGKPSAVFFVSGVMAQQAVLRVWCERRGSLRVALPDLSHLLKHENDGPRLLQGFRFEHLTAGRRTAPAGGPRPSAPRGGPG